MIARIQQVAVLLWIAIAASLLVDLGIRGPAAPSLGALLGVLLGPPILLAAEFALMASVNARRRLQLLERHDADLAVSPGTSILGADGVRRAYLRELAAAIRVFAWQQPFRHSSEPDHDAAYLPAGRGVVLIHGFACNRGLWLHWLSRLRAKERPCVAVNLEPPWGPIERYAAQIEAAVSRLEERTGLAPVLVAHSMGGLAARAWWVGTRPDRVHRLITLGTPHQGTVLAACSFVPNVRQMRRGSPWLRSLAQADRGERRARMSCFWSWGDNIVFPADTAALAGTSNHVLQDAAHVDMVWHPAPWAELQRWLTPPADEAAHDASGRAPRDAEFDRPALPARAR